MDGSTVWSSAVDGSHVTKMAIFWAMIAQPESPMLFNMLPQVSSKFCSRGSRKLRTKTLHEGRANFTRGSCKEENVIKIFLHEGRANLYTRVAQSFTRGSRKPLHEGRANLARKPYTRVALACQNMVSLQPVPSSPCTFSEIASSSKFPQVPLSSSQDNLSTPEFQQEPPSSPEFLQVAPNSPKFPQSSSNQILVSPDKSIPPPFQNNFQAFSVEAGNAAVKIVTC